MNMKYKSSAVDTALGPDKKRAFHSWGRGYVKAGEIELGKRVVTCTNTRLIVVPTYPPNGHRVFFPVKARNQAR